MIVFTSFSMLAVWIMLGSLSYVYTRDILPAAIASFRGPLIDDFWDGMVQISVVCAMFLGFAWWSVLIVGVLTGYLEQTP